ncbi:hypothetical protein ACKWTF_014393 [Chironomus riparius]
MKLLIITFTLLIASCCCQDSFNSHTYPELQVDPKAYSDQQNEDGVWMKWNTTMSGVPSNAVYGGYDIYGATYIIRADHTTPDAIYAGKIIGKYNPWQRMAYVGHNSHEFKKNDFEVRIFFLFELLVLRFWMGFLVCYFLVLNFLSL